MINREIFGEIDSVLTEVEAPRTTPLGSNGASLCAIVACPVG